MGALYPGLGGVTLLHSSDHMANDEWTVRWV